MLRPISFNSSGDCKAKEILEDGRYVFVDCINFDGYYLISPAYLLEIRDELEQCKELLDSN